MVVVSGVYLEEGSENSSIAQCERAALMGSYRVRNGRIILIAGILLLTRSLKQRAVTSGQVVVTNIYENLRPSDALFLAHYSSGKGYKNMDRESERSAS